MGPRSAEIGEKMQYKLSDETIGQIAKLVQLAILTGTDVVDVIFVVLLPFFKRFLVQNDKIFSQ